MSFYQFFYLYYKFKIIHEYLFKFDANSYVFFQAVCVFLFPKNAFQSRILFAQSEQNITYCTLRTSVMYIKIAKPFCVALLNQDE